MSEGSSREPAHNPQDLERLFIALQWAGDVDGMVALYEPDAVVEIVDGQELRGQDAIHAYFAQIAASGRKFEQGEQRQTLVSGDLALTSTRLPDGSVTSEVARRQVDGTWLWVIDRFTAA